MCPWCVLGACLTILRGRDRGRFPLNRGGADVVGSKPNEEATTTSEGKSARSRRVGKQRGVCGVARLARGARHGRRRAPCIRAHVRTHARMTGHAVLLRALCLPTRLTRN